MNEQENEGKMRHFYKTHPQFRKAIDRISLILGRLGRISWAAIAVIIIVIILIAFFTLPEEINKPVSVVVGGILTAFAFPAYIEHQRILHDSSMIKLEKCADFHEHMIEMLIELLNAQDQETQRKIAHDVSNYISENYKLLCMYFTQIQIDTMYFLKDECDMLYKHQSTERASMDILQYTAQKYLNDVRRQGFTAGQADLTDVISQKSEAQP